jgi:hypothetical protein
MKKLFLVTLLSCMLVHSKANAYVKLLSQQQMVDILLELELARAWVYGLENTHQQALVDLLETKVHHIYLEHHTDASTFQHSYLHYLSHTELLIAIYAQVIDRLNDLSYS